MPKGKGKKSQPATSRKKKKAGRGQGASGGITSTAAPQAINTFVRQGVRFSGNGGNLVMSGRIALVDVGTSAAGQTGVLQDYNTNVARGYRLSPGQLLGLVNSGASYVSADQISPALDLLSSAFTRYRMKRCKFIYAPQSTTNTINRITFAYASDPVHPAICPVSPAVTTPEGLEGLADSVVFAPWSGWELDVSRALPKDWLFLSPNNTGDVALTDSSRFEYFGAIGGIITPSSSGATRHGTIYQDFEIEFKEFCPVSIIRPTSFFGIPRETILKFLREQKMPAAKGQEGGRTWISIQVEESSKDSSLYRADGETTTPYERKAGLSASQCSSPVPFPSPDKEDNKERCLAYSGVREPRACRSLEEINELIRDSWPHLSEDERKEIAAYVVGCPSPKDGDHL